MQKKLVGVATWTPGVFLASDYYGAEYQLFYFVPDSVGQFYCKNCSNRSLRPVLHDRKTCSLPKPGTLANNGRGPVPSSAPQVGSRRVQRKAQQQKQPKMRHCKSCQMVKLHQWRARECMECAEESESESESSDYEGESESESEHKPKRRKRNE
jgi:hypothetical protein